MRSLEIEFGGPVLPLLLLATGAPGSGSGCVPLPDAVFCDVLGSSSPPPGNWRSFIPDGHFVPPIIVTWDVSVASSGLALGFRLVAIVVSVFPSCRWSFQPVCGEVGVGVGAVGGPRPGFGRREVLECIFWVP